jgi:hypothetical protein
VFDVKGGRPYVPVSLSRGVLEFSGSDVRVMDSDEIRAVQAETVRKGEPGPVDDLLNLVVSPEGALEWCRRWGVPGPSPWDPTQDTEEHTPHRIRAQDLVNTASLLRACVRSSDAWQRREIAESVGHLRTADEVALPIIRQMLSDGSASLWADELVVAEELVAEGEAAKAGVSVGILLSLALTAFVSRVTVVAYPPSLEDSESAFLEGAALGAFRPIRLTSEGSAIAGVFMLAAEAIAGAPDSPRVLPCANETCKQFFVATDPRKLYHENTCARAQASRQWARRDRAKRRKR